MKQKLFYFASVALFSILFYRQESGLNHLLFSIFQVVFFGLLHKAATTSLQWKGSALAVLISGLSVALWGGDFNVVVWIISCFALSFSSISPGISFLTGMLVSAYTFLCAVILVFVSFFKPEVKERVEGYKGLKNSIIIIVCVVAALFFISLYRVANPRFDDLIAQIDLSFISVSWLIFTCFGAWWLYSMYYFYANSRLIAYDKERPRILNPENSTNMADNWVTSDTEFTLGSALLITLNIVLFFVNLLDIVDIFSGTVTFDGNYSRAVHGGISALVFSIVCAIVIILFFFRGRINFYPKSKTIIYLAYLWMAQNAIIVMLTFNKNWLYVHKYLLTEKRIGVFVFLILCIIGLFFTAQKIKQKCSNWILINRIAWSFLVSLVIFVSINWSQIIVNYHLSRKADYTLDYNYLLRKGDGTFREVYESMTENEKTQYEYVIREQAAYYKEISNNDWRSVTFITEEWEPVHKDIFREEPVEKSN